ncbi:hypothetical protein K474DRAFT_1775945 [Panus rudis PR-1116 ss-1]|nr:hypothetical protein K474DRAFT_1775945 [Panus rudis PR-1116 ss-1]
MNIKWRSANMCIYSPMATARSLCSRASCSSRSASASSWLWACSISASRSFIKVCSRSAALPIAAPAWCYKK